MKKFIFVYGLSVLFILPSFVLADGDRYTSWAHLKFGFHEPEKFRRIFFADVFSEEEAGKIKNRIINILKKKIFANLEKVCSHKKEISKKANKYPSLKRDIASFLENYESIENGLSRLDTVKKGNSLLEKSKNLIKDADELKGKILFQSFFH